MEVSSVSTSEDMLEYEEVLSDAVVGAILLFVCSRDDDDDDDLQLMMMMSFVL